TKTSGTETPTYLQISDFPAIDTHVCIYIFKRRRQRHSFVAAAAAFYFRIHAVALRKQNRSTENQIQKRLFFRHVGSAGGVHLLALCPGLCSAVFLPLYPYLQNRI